MGLSIVWVSYLSHACEVYSVSKWVGIKAKEMRSRITDSHSLPGVEQAKDQIAQSMGAHL